MKSSIVVSIMILCLAGIAFAGEPDIGRHPSCAFCGMDRGQYAHSRVLIEYDDGTSFGACSLHCAAVDLAGNIDKTPLKISVGDYGSKKLIDAEKAVWVLGGARPGVMTGTAKWAFAGKTAASEFVEGNGGRQVDFETAVKAAYEDMYRDTKQIRERRRMKRSLKQKGEQQ